MCCGKVSTTISTISVIGEFPGVSAICWDAASCLKNPDEGSRPAWRCTFRNPDVSLEAVQLGLHQQ